jgi:cation diffusion facilitator CzcD-associated flavoprotein CzcO
MTTSNDRLRTLRIAIIGAGPGGLCMAIRLKEAGFDNFVLLEQGDGVGGTWYHNLAISVREENYNRVNSGMTFSDPAALAQMETYGLGAIEVVQDPELREKLTPQHPFGCKRPLLSNVYYAAFNRPNLELVTDSIERITPDGVVTADGVTRQVDTLIIATGFSATKYLSAIDVTGRGGQRLDDAWNDGARAYLGVTTAGFPNLFMLYGPNTNNGSILTMIESQVEHALQHVMRIANEGLAWIDVRPEPMERYNEDVQRAIQNVKVWQADCNGYYRSRSGRVVTQWPFSMSAFKESTAKPDPDAFEVAPLL